ncbi:MAG: hypothetical protein HY785_01225 [Oscillatoriophycideae cyanobacterium NC_groundwater_1537_Pr4_S-0.65um_50_18]|nr:hypothetical protein [Oscillatoriophycideae cyanobacterium NC_groundwater_1537_Pr4_S-0.65um_50_18]
MVSQSDEKIEPSQLRLDELAISRNFVIGSAYTPIAKHVSVVGGDRQNC